LVHRDDEALPDRDRVDHRVNLGMTEEWVLRNTRSDAHPFHIHVNDFQVVSINGESVAADTWEDTTPIPVFGEIVIRTRFLDFTGKYVYHGHILDHEDRSVMGIVEVVDDGAPTPQDATPTRSYSTGWGIIGPDIKSEGPGFSDAPGLASTAAGGSWARQHAS
jgi:hypothetical protein